MEGNGLELEHEMGGMFSTDLFTLGVTFLGVGENIGMSFSGVTDHFRVGLVAAAGRPCSFGTGVWDAEEIPLGVGKETPFSGVFLYDDLYV